MPRLKAGNNAKSTLAAAIDAVQTSFTVVDASLFPDPPFRVTIDAEIMEVGAIDRATNTFSSVTRGVEGTAAAPHAQGANVENRFTAGTLAELADKAQDVDTKFHASTGHKHSGAAGDAPPVPWANVSGKPATYPPSAHTHARADITDFAHKSTHASGGSDALSPADIGAAPSSHTHTRSQITDFAHTHPGGDITSAVASASYASSAGNADTVDGLHVTGSGTPGLRKITISTADPSGGADGDVWFKYS